MRCVYIKEFGAPENLEVREIPDPSRPQGSEVLVRVRAAGLNRADLLQRKGLYPAPAGYSSNIPGLEFAGEVVDAGEAVRSWTPGDRVMGITAGEAQAEFVSVDGSLLISIPKHLSFAEAAAIPEAFITAHDAIFTLGELEAGQILLVHAAASGVGIAALQMAKRSNVTVIGTSRTEDKLARLSELGLDHPIVPSGGTFAEDVTRVTGGHGADVILDLVGASYLADNLSSLAAKGRLVLVGLTGGSKAEFDLGQALAKRARIIGTTLRRRTVEEKAEASRAFVEHTMTDIESGAITPVIDKIFPADNVRQAHEYLESNNSFGKIVLEF